MTQKHYALWKKPDSKDNTLYDSIYVTFGKGKTIGTEIQSAVDRWLRIWEIQRGMRDLFWVIEILCILIVAMVTWLDKFVKIHRTLHLKRVKFTVCKLYFNQLKKILKGLSRDYFLGNNWNIWSCMFFSLFKDFASVFLSSFIPWVIPYSPLDFSTALFLPESFPWPHKLD